MQRQIVNIPMNPDLKANLVEKKNQIPEGAEKVWMYSNEYFEVWQKGDDLFYYKYPKHLIRSRWKQQSK